jgi:hypothetical protein
MQRSQIEPGGGAIDPLGPGQTMGDWNPHIRRPELRDHRSVTKLDESMHHRLRVHQHIYFIRTEREQMMCLNDLQPLVHECR